MALTPFFPDGKVKLLRNTGLTNQYRDTYDFLSANSQYSFFSGKVKWQFDKVAPVRIGESIRVPRNANACYDCDYLIFQNSTLSNKWFYAFITDISWQSIDSCIISYEIDDIQTWFFERELSRAFIERQTVSNDTIGSNLIPENLELGEYKIYEENNTGFFDQYVFIAACTFDKYGNTYVGGMYSGLYSGLCMNIFETSEDLSDFLTRMTQQNKSSGIVSITMYPKKLLNTTNPSTANWAYWYTTKKQGGTLDGYIPKNKKLYTYPYNYLLVTNNSGGSAKYRYEDFNNPDKCEFNISMDMSCNPTAVMAPYDYNIYHGSSSYTLTDNWIEKITMDGFPQCSWNIDAYKAWLAQNGSATTIGMLGSAFSGIGQLFTGNVMGAVGTGFSIAQSVAQIKATEALPPQAHGPTGSNVLIASKQKDFWVYKVGLKAEFAKIIDDYFSMFGYAIHEVKLPSARNRQYWDYIETKECKCKGNLPSTAARHIEDIYNNGIRYWHGDYLGEYDRINTPRG